MSLPGLGLRLGVQNLAEPDREFPSPRARDRLR